MSVIQRIRDKAAWFIFGAIAISLIAFILQDAFYGRGGGWFGDNSTNVASVNGTKIDQRDFTEKIKETEDYYQRMGMTLNDAMRNNVQNQAWNSMIIESLIKQQAAKVGLTVTDKEFSEMLFGQNPPEFIKQLGTGQDGQFNIEQAKAQFNQIKKLFNDKQKQAQVLEWYNTNVLPFRNGALQQKYTALVSQSSYIPKWMASKTYADANNNANLQYVFVPFATISDSLKVSDADITDYLNRNKKKYWQDEETRSIEYVMFDASPTSQDSATIKNNLATLKPAFETATDSKAFINKNNSKTDYYDAYLLKSKIQVPAKDSIFQLANNQVYGPYQDGGTYVLAKMIDRRQMPDSVKVRHILIGTTNPQTGQMIRPDSVAKKTVDSIKLAIAQGANFDSLCQKFSDDRGADGKPNKNGVYELTSSQFTTFVRPFSEAAFYGKVGDKTVVKTTEFGYFYIEVLSQKNFEEAYKVAYLSKEIYSSDETISTEQTKANSFVAAAGNNYEKFVDLCKKNGYTKTPAEDLSQFGIFQAAGESSREMVRWAFLSKKGEISDVKRLGDKFIVAALVRIKEKGLPKAEDMRSRVENLVRNELKAKEIIKKIGSNNTLEAIAAATGQAVLRSDSVSFASSVAANIGNEPKVIGAAFNKNNKDRASAPIIGNGGVFVIKTESVYAKPNGALTEDGLRSQLVQQLKGSSYSIYETMKKSANIDDKRMKFNY